MSIKIDLDRIIHNDNPDSDQSNPVQEDDFLTHIESLPNEVWETLAAFIPLIESHEGNFGGVKVKDVGAPFKFLFDEQDILVQAFSAYIRNVTLMCVFDWMVWEEGKDYATRDNPNYSHFTFEELCKIFTVMLRGDHFNQGLLVRCFKEKSVLNLLKEIKKRKSSKHVAF